MSENAQQSQWSHPITKLDEFRDLARRIEQPFSEFPRPQGRFFAVLGGVRMGKTSLLNVLPDWLDRHPRRSNKRLAPAQIKYSINEGDLDSPTNFLLCLVKQLREGLRTLNLCTISEQNFEPFFAENSPTDGFRDAFNFLLNQASQASTKENESLANIRLIGLLDEADQIARQPWTFDLFRELRALYAREKQVSERLDLVWAGEDRLARLFASDAPWADGGRMSLGTMPQEIVSTWLQEISEGRSPPALAQAVTEQSGGHPLLVSYFVHEIQHRAGRSRGWEGLAADVLDRLAERFAETHQSALDAWMFALLQSGMRDAMWSACNLLVEAGDAGLDIDTVEDRLWNLGIKDDPEQMLKRLQWKGVALPAPNVPDRFVTGKLFRRYFQQRQDNLPQPPEETMVTRRQWSLEYDDFFLRLSAEQERYRIRIQSSQGEANHVFDLPISVRDYVWRQTLWGPGAETEAKEIGAKLFETLFSPNVLSVFHRAQNDAIQARRGLRLKLVLEPPDLHRLPWEFLYDRQGRHNFLVLFRDTPLIRYVESTKPIPDFPTVDKLRLLAVVARPINLPTLDFDTEVDNIREALGPWQERGWLEYQIIQGQEANSTNLRHILRQETPHILHFLGHGSFDPIENQGRLWLEGEDREGEPLAARQLATLLADIPNLRLVFLNACQTASSQETTPFASMAGNLVQSGIPAVVATQHAISNLAATHFSREFYRALAEFYPVEAAVAEGRKAIDVSVKSYEWGAPVLYLRAQDGDVFRQG